MRTTVAHLLPVLEAWQRGKHAHEPITIAPAGDGETYVAQVGGRREMNVTELIAFLGITRHAWYQRYHRYIQPNRNRKYGIRAAIALKERISGALANDAL